MRFASFPSTSRQAILAADEPHFVHWLHEPSTQLIVEQAAFHPFRRVVSRMGHRFHVFLPGASWTRFLLAPALVFLATALDRNYQTDFCHHLARRRAMAEQGGLVNEDLFTHTRACQPLQDANRLTLLLYYWF